MAQGIEIRLQPGNHFTNWTKLRNKMILYVKTNIY